MHHSADGLIVLHGGAEVGRIADTPDAIIMAQWAVGEENATRWGQEVRALLATPGPKAAAPAPATSAAESVYTDTTGDCTNEAPEGMDASGVCKGHGGYTLRYGYTLVGELLKLQDASGNELADLNDGCGTARFGKKTEWRTRDGAPIAMILRRHCGEPGPSGEFMETSQSLLVRGLGPHRGRDTAIDAGTAGANVAARAAADRP